MQKRILVVEDEPSIAENITYALSTEQFNPLWCGTGEEALQAIVQDTIDLVILDIGLPDINGFDLLKEIRNTCSLPVIFLTARADEVDRVVGLEIGADDYIVKPFSPRELTARVRAVLRRISENTLSDPGDDNPAGRSFQVDKKRLMISYYGKTLELSRYEYRLLSVLISNPGRVYTREQLMTRVWEEPDMSLERTVDTHIKTIRRKLRAINQEDDPIVTHRGVGYSLREPL